MFSKISNISYNIIAPRLTSSQYEALKILAIITMTIAHIGLTFDDTAVAYFAIGRVALPLFAFLMVYSYLFHTTSPVTYITRILIVALFAQGPYMLWLDLGDSYAFLNIMFTLAFGLIIIYVIDLALKQKKQVNKYAIIYMASMFFLASGVFVDYIHLGLMIVIAYWLWLKYPSHQTLFGAIAMTALLNFPNGYMLMMAGLFSLLFIILFTVYNHNIKRVNKWFFYLFFPGHIILLHLISKM